MDNTPHDAGSLDPAELEIRLQEQKRKLDAIKPKMACTDQLLVHLMARRIQLALRVAKAKHPAGSSTFRAEVEESRLNDVTRWANEERINPNFPRSLLYMIMDESCKVQGEYREKLPRYQKEDYSPEKLRQNLLLLTQKWAPKYDAMYAPPNSLKSFQTYFETNVLSELISKLPQNERGSILEIGCATGRELFQHADKFGHAIGLDVSPHMIDQAKQNRGKLPQGARIPEFRVYDVEQGIPQSPASISCVYMNHGTAGDIQHITEVLREVRRVLRPGGVFHLSFYNSDALMYQTYLPWPPVLGAEIDKEDHCIEVYCDGEVLSVYARAYSVSEAEELLPSGLVRTQTLTHPTVGSIMPKDVFENPEGLNAMRAIDLSLSGGEYGAYIVITGKRV